MVPADNEVNDRLLSHSATAVASHSRTYPKQNQRENPTYNERTNDRRAGYFFEKYGDGGESAQSLSGRFLMNNTNDPATPIKF